jgi:hypothetical protein
MYHPYFSDFLLLRKFRNPKRPRCFWSFLCFRSLFMLSPNGLVRDAYPPLLTFVLRIIRSLNVITADQRLSLETIATITTLTNLSVNLAGQDPDALAPLTNLRKLVVKDKWYDCWLIIPSANVFSKSKSSALFLGAANMNSSRFRSCRI